MQIIIDIPEEEFGIDINDKFQDFFQRLRVEIKEHLISGTGLVCGAYELETIEMFLNAFANSITLSKGHGDLIDELSTIIEADRSRKVRNKIWKL